MTKSTGKSIRKVTKFQPDSMVPDMSLPKLKQVVLPDEILAATLNWLLNYYELNTRASARERATIVDRVEKILNDYPPSVAGAQEMRKKYPI